jgi:ribosomal protein L17
MKAARRPRQAARKETPMPAAKPMRDALLKSLNREAKKGKPTKRLQAIVDKLVELAMKGDFYAIREIFDRIDGRVPQPVAGEEGKGRAGLQIGGLTDHDRAKKA